MNKNQIAAIWSGTAAVFFIAIILLGPTLFVPAFDAFIAWVIIIVLTTLAAALTLAAQRDFRLNLDRGLIRSTLALSLMAFAVWTIASIIVAALNPEQATSIFINGLLKGLTAFASLWLACAVIIRIIIPLFRFIADGFSDSQK